MNENYTFHFHQLFQHLNSLKYIINIYFNNIYQKMLTKLCQILWKFTFIYENELFSLPNESPAIYSFDSSKMLTKMAIEFKIAADSFELQKCTTN